MARNIIGWVLITIVGLAIYRMNNGNVEQMIHSVWALISKGADIVTSIFKKFLSMQSTSSGSKAGSSTAMIIQFFN